jgi:hypothetical protein
MAAIIQSVAYHGARKVRQLALCWRMIAFIAHRIGDRTDPDIPAEARRAVDTGSAGPLGHSCNIGPPASTLFTAARADTPRCSICTALLNPDEPENPARIEKHRTGFGSRSAHGYSA